MSQFSDPSRRPQQTAREFLEQAEEHAEVQRWLRQNPTERALRDKFYDLIRYNPEIKQLAERLPMLLRLSSTTENKQKLSLEKALAAWQKLEKFYHDNWNIIERTTKKNREFYSSEKLIDREKPVFFALHQHSEKVEEAHKELACFIRTVVSELGFTFGSIAPLKERKYRKIA